MRRDRPVRETLTGPFPHSSRLRRPTCPYPKALGAYLEERHLVYQIHRAAVMSTQLEEDMTLPNLHPAPPEEMTPRARIYLASGVFRYVVYALFALALQDQFAAAAFIPIIGFVDLTFWGLLFAFAAGALGIGALFRQRTIARLGLIVSAGVTGLLAAGLWIGAVNIWVEGGKATALFAATLTTLVIKDLAVCTDPMKTPLELTDLWRRVVNGGVT